MVQYKLTAYESDDICKLAIKSEHMLPKRNIFSSKNTKKGMLKYQSNRHYRTDIPNLWPKEYTGDTLREIYMIGNKLPDTDFIVRDSIGVEINKMIQGVKYSGKDMVVYVSGNTIVTYNLSRKQKSFFIYHKKKISAINVLFAPPHDKTNIVASAETLDNPQDTAKIIVWLSESKEILAEISHLRGFIIEKIIFHPDGERLIVISYNGSYYRYLKSFFQPHPINKFSENGIYAHLRSGSVIFPDFEKFHPSSPEFHQSPKGGARILSQNFILKKFLLSNTLGCQSTNGKR